MDHRRLPIVRRVATVQRQRTILALTLRLRSTPLRRQRRITRAAVVAVAEVRRTTPVAVEAAEITVAAATPIRQAGVTQTTPGKS